MKAVSQKEANYTFVTRALVKRYIAHVQRNKQQSEGVTEDDVNEIKQDISSFRYELLEILRNAGYETGHTNSGQKTTGMNDKRVTLYKITISFVAAKNKRRTAQAERRLMKGFQFDTIHETSEHSVPKVPLVPEQSGVNGKSKTSPVATKIAKFRKLSRKIPLAKRLVDLSGSDKSRSRPPKLSETSKPRASSVELEQYGEMAPLSYHRRASGQWRATSQSEHSLSAEETQTAIPPTAVLNIPKRDSFLWRTVSSDSQDEASVKTKCSGSLDVEAQPDDALL